MLSELMNHDQFFARLVNMIPTELYQHTDSMTGFKNDPTEEAVEETNLVVDRKDKEKEKKRKSVEEIEETNKYYKHKKQPLSADEKKLFRQEIKKRKYDPSASELETGILPRSSSGATTAMDVDDDDDHDITPNTAIMAQNLLVNGAESKNVEELRKRLQDRIQQMKAKRQSKKTVKNSRKQAKSSSVASVSTIGSVGSASSNVIPNRNGSSKASLVDADEHSVSSQQLALYRADMLKQELLDAPSLEFNPITQVTASIDEQIRLKLAAQQKKSGGGKKQRLQKLLQESERKRERLRMLSTSDDAAQVARARAEQWNDVLTTASGGKALVVSIDGQEGSKAVMKIKKAIKRADKKKERSARDWQQRTQTLADEQTAKIEKKQQNILNRKQRNHIGALPEKKEGAPAASGHGPAAAGGKNNRAGFEGKKGGGQGKFLNHNKLGNGSSSDHKVHSSKGGRGNGHCDE